MLETNKTHQLKEIYVRKEDFGEIFVKGTAPKVKELSDTINSLVQKIKVLLEKRFVMMENKAVWYDNEVAALYPKYEEYPMPITDTYNSYLGVYNREHIKNTKYDSSNCFESMDVDGISMGVGAINILVKTFSEGVDNPYLEGNNFKKNIIKGDCSYLNCFVGSDWRQGSYLYYHVIKRDGEDSRNYGNRFEHSCRYEPILVCHSFNDNKCEKLSLTETLQKWFEYGLIPEGLDYRTKKVYTKLMMEYKIIEDYLEWLPEEIKVDTDRLAEDVLAGNFTETVFDHSFDLKGTLENIMSGREQYVGSPDAFMQQLLECDTKRANLTPYPESRLTDINLGHWEMFEIINKNEHPNMAKVTLPNDTIWAARPPQLDVVMSGTCAIDFGTKSTVVVCRDENGSRMLRIGKGDYTKAAVQEDYENPTVIALDNVKKFVESYSSRDGRPFTDWNDVFVSHQASEELIKQDADPKIYYSVFSELKQWANAPKRRLILRDRNDNSVELPPYLELGENDFDPIEAYAYYLGLYINNMYNMIYLDYILSFPVNYSLQVQEKIRQSIEKGIRKSLPPAILEDEGLMERFQVYAGASEPASYAISALQEYGLEPKNEGDVTAYGVFDFGGGTTDFDFGIERVSPNRRKCKLIIDQFGKGGDVYLGGENILSLLAYEVYKANIDAMREKGITFAQPPETKCPAGAETLILDANRASEYAYMNTKALSEAMRPFWEHHEGLNKQLEQGDLKVTLFKNQKEQNKETIQLKINKDALEKIMEERIQRGVNDFFSAYFDAFRGREEQPEQFHILLAGNSCKSPIVQKLFNEAIEKYSKEIAAATNKSADNLFKLHLPLGMKLAKAGEENAEKSDVVVNNTELDRQITGKTGVAFGLLRSRRGGKDVKINNANVSAGNEIVFPYFIGDIDEDYHFHVRIGKGVDYNVWAPFCYADENRFEIYYTRESSAIENKLSPSEVRSTNCIIGMDEVSDDDEVMIYIRKTKPDTIEYAVGIADEFTNEELVAKKKIYTVNLS